MGWIHLNANDPIVKRIVGAAFPSYRGRHIVASIRDKVSLHGTQWDEGNKNEYVIVRLSDMSVQSIHEAPFLQHSPLHESSHVIPPGFVVVKHGISRWEHIEIIGPSDNISPMLGAPTELSPDEKIVLCATRSLKSSYGGVSNYRFHEAKSQTGIDANRWEQAKQSLMDKKLLAKNGAITTEGRNAIGDTQLYSLRSEA